MEGQVFFRTNQTWAGFYKVVRVASYRRGAMDLSQVPVTNAGQKVPPKNWPPEDLVSTYKEKAGENEALAGFRIQQEEDKAGPNC
jgi:hypothetical protein